MKQEIYTRAPSDDEEMRKQACLELFTQDRQKLLQRWPFIGGVIMRMELIPVRDDRLETACTDGDNIFVDIDFYAKLTKEERQFVLAHEVWHSVLLHFARRQGRDRELFNIAADLEIHFALEGEKMREPFVLPYHQAWRWLPAEQIYEDLPEFLKSLKESEDDPGIVLPENDKLRKDTPFGDGASGFDKHVYSGDQLPAPGEQHDGKKGIDGSQGDGDGTSGRRDDTKGSESNPFVVDKDYAPSVASDAVDRSRSRTVATVQQLERTCGELSGEGRTLIDRILTPELPWQEMLKQFITTCYGGRRRWLPPSRRHVWQNLYLPSMRDEELKAVVAIDTSGSTSRDLPAFFSELVSLMRSFGRFSLDVIQCDARVQCVEHYSQDNLPPPDRKWNVRGFGGTNFCPVFGYIQREMSEKPDILIFFTDGFGLAPENQPPYPVMWVLTKKGIKPASWGRVTYLQQEN